MTKSLAELEDPAKERRWKDKTFNSPNGSKSFIKSYVNKITGKRYSSIKSYNRTLLVEGDSQPCITAPIR